MSAGKKVDCEYDCVRVEMGRLCERADCHGFVVSTVKQPLGPFVPDYLGVNIMGRRSESSGDSDLLVWFFDVFTLVGTAIVQCLVLVIAGLVQVIAGLIAMFSESEKNRARTVTFSRTFWGDRKKTIDYHDTGKRVEQVRTTNLLGNREFRTYVTRPDQGPSKKRYQRCRNCGATVGSSDGFYNCSCGRHWGRR